MSVFFIVFIFPVHFLVSFLSFPLQSELVVIYTYIYICHYIKLLVLLIALVFTVIQDFISHHICF